MARLLTVRRLRHAPPLLPPPSSCPAPRPTSPHHGADGRCAASALPPRRGCCRLCSRALTTTRTAAVLTVAFTAPTLTATIAARGVDRLLGGDGGPL